LETKLVFADFFDLTYKVVSVKIGLLITLVDSFFKLYYDFCTKIEVKLFVFIFISAHSSRTCSLLKLVFIPLND
jgi:hypothetical protein